MTGPFMPADPMKAIWDYQRQTGIDISKDGLPYGHAIRHDNYGNAYVCGSVFSGGLVSSGVVVSNGAGRSFNEPTPVDWERWNRHMRRNTAPYWHIVAWLRHIGPWLGVDLGDLWID